MLKKSVVVGYCVVFWTAILLSHSAFAQSTLHHDLKLKIFPETHRIEVQDTISLPQKISKSGFLNFVLHKNLKVDTTQKNIQKIESNSPHWDDKLNDAAIQLNQYRISLTRQQKSQPQVVIRYQGEIHHEVKKSAEESARSMSDSAGIVDQQGVFLARTTYWYAIFGKQLISFDLKIELPSTWDVVSQGQRIQHTIKDGKRIVHWQEKQAQDDLYVVAAKFKQYLQSTGATQAMVFLRNEDIALAQKYLDTTAQYINMYSRIFGPYPYTKFALVENFWESGYGMPSFTLLGPKVIRFPFILHSSYPHEILHNWWGNSVYVDYSSGNWAEGLTAYLADHLVKQQRGSSAAYRKSVLQKYTDFVSEGRDFPLTEFRSRHSAATEAVGYGKTMMFFHMLRRQLGDRDFVRSLAMFYRQNQFKTASFSDIKNAFSQASELDLDGEFKQWVERTGAPVLSVENVALIRKKQTYQLKFELQQTQASKAYELDVPIAVYFKQEKGRPSSKPLQKNITMQRKSVSTTLNLDQEPIKIDIDPQFDIFRRLHNKEIASALSQGFGAEKVLIVLSSQEKPKLKSAYKKLAEQWKKTQPGEIELKLDSEIDNLPNDRALWLLGWNNRFSRQLIYGLTPEQFKEGSGNILLNGKQYNRQEHSLIVTSRNQDNKAQTVLWLATQNENALPGLTRKLPHYRKYSYLIFEGNEPTNIAKGQWPITHSPMTYVFNSSALNSIEQQKLDAQAALAQLPPVFSEKDMLRDVQFLASADLKGRGLGTPQLDKAAGYIADQFKQAGLLPGGDSGNSYFQSWEQDVGEPLGKVTLKNVVAILPGSNNDIQQESLIISAHYDHLGLGWPDVHKGDAGKIHFGADDNASGVAVMLELARQVAQKWKPQRSIIFIAFTGEETGLLGSDYYVNSISKVNNESMFPLEKVMGVLNLDTVGRVGDGPVTVFGTGSAREWVHIFRGAGFVTGIKLKSVAKDFGSSDQKSFLDKGVAAVQLFGSAHQDFHRPGDTVEKVDVAGMIKVAAVLKEAAEYLSDRIEPLHVKLENRINRETSQLTTKRKPDERRVSLGSVPDFAYQGQGVRITGTVPGSPAHKAQLQPGDIIQSLGGKKISDLSDLSKKLRNLSAGQTVSLSYLRDNKLIRIQLKVVER